MRRFRVFRHPQEAKLAAFPGRASLGICEDEKTVSTEAVRCTIDGGQEAKMEILDIDSNRGAPWEFWLIWNVRKALG
jgi:hypothetical protein